LKDKLKEFTEEPAKPVVETDVLSALENLGYSRPMAEAAVRRAANGDEDAAFDVLFKRALQILTKE
jgi:Holliday junction resolvasome RuvABC DNA-binding subunit